MTVPQNNPLIATVAFVDIAGAETDPASGIEIHVRAPDGTTDVYAYPSDITRVSQGVYTVEFEATQAGNYLARGQGILANGLVVTSKDVKRRLEPTRIG